MPTHPCGLVLVGINDSLALTPCVAVDCLPRPFLVGAAEPLPADADTVPDAAAEPPPARLVHGLEVFCDCLDSRGKLLLNSFFCSSTDFAAVNSSRRLFSFIASSGFAIAGFNVSLNLSICLSADVLASSHSLKNSMIIFIY